MHKKLKTNWTCACEEKHELFFRKPPFTSDTICPVQCKSCESKFIIKLARRHGLDPGQLHSSTKILYISPHLKMFMEKKGITNASPKL